MSKIISKEELIALYNEIETLRLEARNSIETEINRKTRVYSTAEMLHEAKRTFKSIDIEIIEWIFGKRKFTEIEEYLQEDALNVLFQGADLYNSRDKEFQAIQEFLKATEDPMFVEIAEKLAMFQEKELKRDDQKIKTGVMLLNQFDSKDRIDTSYEYHYRTIKSESKEITKSTKTANKYEQTKIRKFRNIYKIYQNNWDLYNKIIKFIMEHDNYPYGLYDGEDRKEYSLKHIEEIVYEHQQDAIEMLYDLEYLQFAFSQKKGKIK